MNVIDVFLGMMKIPVHSDSVYSYRMKGALTKYALCNIAPQR